MRRITLPDGGWADLVDRDEMTVRQQRLIGRCWAKVGPDLAAKFRDADSVGALGLSEDEISAMYDLADAGVLAVVTAWSYGDVDADTLAGLRGDVYDVVSAETAKVTAAVATATAAAEPSPEPDPSNPTGPSVAFVGDWRETSASTSTPTLRTPGTNTGSVAPSADSTPTT